MPSSDVDSDVVRIRFGLGAGGSPSSLNGGDDEPEHHDALLLPPGLDPSRVGQCGECGEHDKLISTRAALHASIGSSPFGTEFKYNSLS